MIDIMLDIPYKIIDEYVKYDYGSIIIHRTYKLPKSLFKSPNDYLYCIRKWERKVIIQDELKAFIYTTGWKDANCSSYGIMIIIEPEESFK